MTTPRLLAILISLPAALVLLAAPTAAHAEFGIEPGSFAASAQQGDGRGAYDEGATPDMQAGEYPFALSTAFNFNLNGKELPEGNARDTVVQLPPGVVGDPNAIPRCQPATLVQTGFCPNDTAIGVARLLVSLVGEYSVERGGGYHIPVYNMVPSRGELALFGFHIPNPSETPFIHIHLRSGSASDYAVTATVSNISQLGVPAETQIVLWGVPADGSHDLYRGGKTAGGGGKGCLSQLTGESEGSCLSDVAPKPLLRAPTSCSWQPLATSLYADSWENPAPRAAEGLPNLEDLFAPQWSHAIAESPALTGCEKLVFNPLIEVAPETTQVDTPSGYTIHLRVPQNEDAYSLATPDLRDAKVTLPVGVGLSPAAAQGLEACTPAEIKLHSEEPTACPNGSKLGTLTVASPDLPQKEDGSEGTLTGALYLGAPESGVITNPPYTLYLVAEGYGIAVKLEGQATADPVTGQLTTTFDENPQLPFEELTIKLFGGGRAPLTNPPTCGSFAATTALVPWSSSTPATPSSPPFSTSWDSHGAGCPSPTPFAPSFEAGSTATGAGAFTGFIMNIDRPDGQQQLSQITIKTPPGLTGMVSHVTQCPEPQAAQGTCPASSQIGTATAGVGAGPEPFQITGPVYFAGPYRGAPFGLSVVIPAKAGPFDLGDVVVRSAISVDPHTAQLLVSSDAIPTMTDTSAVRAGIPVDLQDVSVNIDRPEFMLNPTSCAPMAVAGRLTSNGGAGEQVSSRFQVGGCSGLAFHPSFAVETSGRHSRAYGASLDVKIGSGAGQANIRSVHVELPRQLPSRVSTLNHACTEAVFASNPAGCPAESIVGYATASTPILPVPLRGPAIFVSHGGAKFPDLDIVLQGYGVTAILTGNTFIDKRGVTSSTFASAPDVPITSFELKLPESLHSALGANGELCPRTVMTTQRTKVRVHGRLVQEVRTVRRRVAVKLLMPTKITGQDGAQVKQATVIKVVGCGAVLSRKARAARRNRHQQNYEHYKRRK